MTSKGKGKGKGKGKATAGPRRPKRSLLSRAALSLSSAMEKNCRRQFFWATVQSTWSTTSKEAPSRMKHLLARTSHQSFVGHCGTAEMHPCRPSKSFKTQCWRSSKWATIRWWSLSQSDGIGSSIISSKKLTRRQRTNSHSYHSSWTLSKMRSSFHSEEMYVTTTPLSYYYYYSDYYTSTGTWQFASCMAKQKAHLTLQCSRWGDQKVWQHGREWRGRGWRGLQRESGGASGPPEGSLQEYLAHWPVVLYDIGARSIIIVLAPLLLSLFVTHHACHSPNSPGDHDTYRASFHSYRIHHSAGGQCPAAQYPRSECNHITLHSVPFHWFFDII